VADNDQRAGDSGLPQGLQNPLDHLAANHREEDLGKVALHACTFAGGQDNSSWRVAHLRVGYFP
ncbi:MAG: hypothetical protein ACK53L_28570, partial [Pirellulaceae bacterium]